MADQTHTTPATPPPARKRNPLLWAGGALAVLLVGLILWGVSPLSPFQPGATPTPTVQPPTPIPPTGTPGVDVPPTPVVGAATFTPEPGQGVSGPQVLGITAGVGMRPGQVAGAAPIAVTFSEAMDQASAQAAFALAPAVQGAFQWTQNTLLFTPNAPLAPSTAYTVTMGSEAKTSGGKTLAAPLSARFQTAPPPAILRTLPSTGASEVPTDTVVTISFNRPMIPLTALDAQPDPGQWVTISPAVAGRWVWLGTGAVGFRAEPGFLPASDYTVDVKAGWPDDSGVPLAQGTAFRFTTIKPAILSVSPGNGATQVALDADLVVRFNMPMDHESVQNAFTPHVSERSAALPGAYAWSPDSTVLTFTPASLLEFDKTYGVVIGGPIKPATGNAADLSGPANLWQFSTTAATHVENTYPSSEQDRPAQPSNNFGFSFNNPLAPNQNVAQYLTINPTPEGYKGQLEITGGNVFTDQIRLLPNTLYQFALKEGLKDKWGFPVAPHQWQVQIGPLPPTLSIKGGSFQPIYSGAPTRARLETANLDKVTLHLYALSENELRDLMQNPPSYSSTPVYPGHLQREWEITIPQGQEVNTSYPALALNGATDRLPAGIYFLRATAPSPYSTQPLEGSAMLLVGRTGLVTKSEGRDLLVWAADLGSGKPIAGYPLRVEQWRQGQQAVVQRGRSGPDGVWRLTLDAAANVDTVAIWGEQQGDLAFVTTGWSANINPYDFNGISGGNEEPTRSALYTDRPIYRPAQTVYFRGILRLDDDARYTLPQAGQTVSLLANTYSPQGETRVYTGTATLSPVGTFNGQFVLPAGAPTGNYTLRFAPPGEQPDSYYGYGGGTTSFDVQEYRKPDFQVNVTAGPSAIHGDPVTATIQTSYYFGGPLVNVTTTINLQSSTYYFGWSDPNTGESYTFGEGYPIIYYDYYRGGPFPPVTPQPVQSFQARTDQNGLLTVDVSRYVTTTESSQNVLIEGQVQDLSNQAVANSASTVVHQGLYYVGLRVGDYIATASQPTTITVRTIAPDPTAPGGGRIQPNTPVKLSFVRQEWVPPTDGSGQWKLNEVPAGETTVTSDAQGRATYFYTPPSGGNYKLRGTSTDSRGNHIHSSVQFWVTSRDAGTVPWHFTNEQQVELVADKESYKIGDTARILVTSPFSQATGLLTIERGHLERYQLVNIQGGAPTVEVKLEAGDLPNVYVGLTLLGPERPPAGAPADWGDHATMRQGYVNLSVDTSSKALSVSIEPQGQGPFAPGTTATMTVRTRDANGQPAPGELSLAVVDEAIYALAAANDPALFATFWGERGLGVRTSSSFSAGDYSRGYRGGTEFDLASGAAPPPVPAAPQATESTARDSANTAQAPAAPQKVRVDFRDTAFWTATISTGPDGSATVPVPLPDNLTTWRLTAQGITANTLAGMASTPLTVTQPLLLRPVQPRFLTTGDNPHPQAIIHNNTGQSLDVVASLVVSGALTLDAQPAAEQKLTIASGEQAVVTWSAQVGKGDTANLRYWVHTLDANSPDYREDAVGATLPVKPFAAPETVATSGEVNGVRAAEHVFLPYSVSPLLGELVVQVSPSLAAATTDSINYVKEYPFESTDQTVSRFLPLIVLEGVYNKQGLKTQFAADLPGIVEQSLKRLAELQQPDGGWAWWERGPSNWWETAYAVQGLAAARDAGYAVPGDMLQRGIERLKNFAAENSTAGIDETYHLNMRAYTLYVLGNTLATKALLQDDARDLLGQTARLSTHARAWLALGLAQIGLQGESKQVLDSLAASTKQTSTTAHWEEGSPDYWSGGTDNRATALAIDALVTLAPNDPLIPKAVRWLMSAEKEGHWLSSQETAISLISLAHYIDQSKELQANYAWQVSLFDQLMGQNVANTATLTRTTTLRMPVEGLPQNTLGNLILARDQANGKMYYQASLRYYVPGEGIKSRSEGLAITRSYYRMSGGEAVGDPITEAGAGDLVKVRLTLAVPDTAYYVLVTDPLPAGLEGVNGSLNTTSFTERPPNPFGINANAEGSAGGYYDWWWRWGPFDNVEMRDTQTVLFATYMSPGTYVYEYYARATTPGTYLNLPAHAELSNFPDVFGHSDGGTFTVK